MELYVKMPLDGYKIFIKNAAIQEEETYKEILPDGKTLLVTDDGVPERYVKEVASHFNSPIVVTLPQGEQSKSLDNYAYLLKVMTENDFTRYDKAIAIGGGVIGDLCGFAAATYMRGIAFYNFPTTFLAQVDSSIGGKTAVDFCGVKNIAGAFHYPKKVIIDPSVLTTLPIRQLSAGIAESIKMAATSDEALFELLETAANEYPTNFTIYSEKIIEKSLRIKKSVVEQDPTETGLRKVLNFGHTLGHAIESSFNGELLHGECVALGTLPLCAKSVRERLEKLYIAYKLPTRLTFSQPEILRLIRHDKKAVNAKEIQVVYVEEIGKFTFDKETAETLAARCEKILQGENSL